MPQTEQERTQLAEQLETEREERALQLLNDRHEREVKDAERRAKREAEVDGKIERHEDRLNAINGNIARFATGIEDLKTHIVKRDELQDKRNTEYDTREKEHWRQRGQAFSRKQAYLAFAAIIATASSPGLVDLVKSIFGG